MKVFRRIIWDSKPPEDTNSLWFNNSVFHLYRDGEWEAYTLPVDAADKVAKVLENASEVYQEKLNAGYGVVIEDNTISLDPLSMDSELSETSENPVQNKVVTAVLNEHTEKLNTIDGLRYFGAILERDSREEIVWDRTSGTATIEAQEIAMTHLVYPTFTADYQVFYNVISKNDLLSKGGIDLTAGNRGAIGRVNASVKKGVITLTLQGTGRIYDYPWYAVAFTNGVVPIPEAFIPKEVVREETLEQYVSETKLGDFEAEVVDVKLSKKQNKLESGKTIKTINGESLLGEGNIVIPTGSGGGSYDDTEIREQLTELSAETMRVLKGYGASSLVYSESLNDNGTTSSASLTKTSEYIEIPIDATRLYYSLSAGRVLFCLYDANKQLVNAFLTFSSEKKLEEGVVNLNAYSNAKYIRFACWDSLKANSYIHFSNMATSEDVDVVAEELFGQTYNKYDLIYAERLDKNNGNAVSASTIKCSDFLPIPNDVIALYYNLVANNCNICLYDADKTFLESVLVTDSQKLVKGEVRTNGASYFRFNCKIDFMDECYVRLDEVAKKKDLVAVDNKVEVSVEELREDLYNGYYTKQDLIFNEVLDRNGVTVSASTIMTSDYLQIPNGTGVLKYNLCANTVLLCLYDSDKSFIDYIPVSNSSELVEGEINPKDYGASFFRFNCKIALMDKCYVKLLKGNGEQGGGANGEDVALNAKAYGAVGDGITDDTDALEQLFADAYEQQRPIYIPKGTYMIRRSLPIKSNLHIYGEGKNSVIKKFPAIWSKVTKDIAEGDTIIYVESVNGFKVGSQVFITNGTNKAQVAARHCSIGVIEEVNAENNSIRFRSSYDGIKTGAIKSQSKGCYISSSCAILRSWSMFSAAINVRIHDITLDGNRQDGEPMEWFNAPIHFDPDDKGELYGIPYKYSSYNHTIRDCYCINSSYDGISDQGSSHCVIENTTISNCAMHGVHFGTGFYNGKVLNCNIDGNGERGAAIFFCASVKDVIVSNNMITNYYRGASDEEYATEGTDAIIVGNIFDNITDTAFNFVMASEERIGGRHIVANNLLRDIGTLFKGDHIRNVSIANNVIEGVTQSGNPLISITQSEYATIIGNVWNGSMSNVVDLTDTTKVIHANNTWNL